MLKSAIFWRLLAATVLCAASCSPGDPAGRNPQLGSQTNWLRTCTVSSECSGLECLCGICTKPCSASARCGAEVDGSECFDSSATETVAICGGRPPSTGLCLTPCGDTLCPEGASCVAGSCHPTAEATAVIRLKPNQKEQILIGLGASLAYDEDTIENSPLREELLDAMFEASGLQMVRLRNRYNEDQPEALARTRSLLESIQERLGSPPTLYMTSGSPPDELKANGSRYCSQSDVACTLRRTAGGDFDYQAFGEHWRSSLAAYAEAGVVPDYVSIQNHPNWVPPSDEASEACRFLAEEGTAQVTLPDGSQVDAEFPGYGEALAAAHQATASLGQYSFTGSETLTGLPDYLVSTNAELMKALSVIFYSVQPEDPNLDLLRQVREYALSLKQPILQTEVSAAGFETCLLIHHAFSALGASAYLQASFLGDTISDASSAVVGTDGDQVVRLPVFHALTHFSRFIPVGWQRISATSSSAQILATAWVDPASDGATVVLINQGDRSETVAVESGALDLRSAKVIRTTFDGVERSLALGPIARDQILPLPARAIVTVTTSQ